MLANIRSLYIMKKILFNLSERTFLKLIKYNDKYKQKMNINLLNYKNFNGKIILYETNNKGKEYDKDGELIYEGEYLNGERNGEGMEYNNEGETIFEGQYSKGKRNGKGREYYNNKLIFEGEYLNGKRWNGNGYDKNDNYNICIKKW